MPPEAYVLTAKPRSVTIAAGSRSGFDYGMTTLRQLFGKARIANAVTIVDGPMYRWRGLHLDVSRHFFPVRVLERYIDLAAHYKLNIFHWHLTDNQAWRLEIKRYPNLTSSASCARACEFYSQDDVRHLVRYALERNVTIVPEVEMPAHAGAALRAYPQLACGGGDVMCARRTSLSFVKDVLEEVLALFPSDYVHVGGDEAPRDALRYFMPRVEAFLRSHGRTMVAWDDVLGSGVSAGTVITAWNGDRRAVAAIRQGHNVIMVPDGPLYFDAYQGASFQEPVATSHMATLEQVYSYDPTPDGLNAAQRARILGVEGAVWTEKIRSTKHLFEMVLPRALALSEIAWTRPERKSWPDFLSRLPRQLSWLREHGYPFRLPSPSIAVAARMVRFISLRGNTASALALTDAGEVNVSIADVAPDVKIRYTLDGSAPTGGSLLYTSPLRLKLVSAQPRSLIAAAFDDAGTRSETSAVIIRKLSPLSMRQQRGSRSWASLVSP